MRSSGGTLERTAGVSVRNSSRHVAVNMTWPQVKKLRKSMRRGYHNFGKSLTALGAQTKRSPAELYEALTGVGRYSDMPKTHALVNLEAPLVPGQVQPTGDGNGGTKNMEATYDVARPAPGTIGNGESKGGDTSTGTNVGTDARPHSEVIDRLTVTLPRSAGPRIMPIRRIERVLQAAATKPGGTQGDWARESGVSVPSVSAILGGTGSYKFLRQDPYWQRVLSILFTFGSGITRSFILRRGDRPNLYNPTAVEEADVAAPAAPDALAAPADAIEGGIADLEEQADDAGEEGGAAYAQAVQNLGLYTAPEGAIPTPPGAPPLHTLFGNAAGVAARVAAESAAEVEDDPADAWAFDDEEADLTPEDEPAQPVLSHDPFTGEAVASSAPGANPHNPTHSLIEWAPPVYVAAPTHEGLAEAQAELEKIPVPTAWGPPEATQALQVPEGIVDPRLIDAAWNLIALAGGPKALGLRFIHEAPDPVVVQVSADVEAVTAMLVEVNRRLQHIALGGASG